MYFIGILCDRVLLNSSAPILCMWRLKFWLSHKMGWIPLTVCFGFTSQKCFPFPELPSIELCHLTICMILPTAPFMKFVVSPGLLPSIESFVSFDLSFESNFTNMFAVTWVKPQRWHLWLSVNNSFLLALFSSSRKILPATYPELRSAWLKVLHQQILQSQLWISVAPPEVLWMSWQNTCIHFYTAIKLHIVWTLALSHLSK